MVYGSFDREGSLIVVWVVFVFLIEDTGRVEGFLFLDGFIGGSERRSTSGEDARLKVLPESIVIV